MADPRQITTKKARPRLGGSAQLRWMQKKQKASKCRACGKERPAELKQLCRRCQDRFNAYIKQWRKERREKAVSSSSSAKQE